jgi:uncharacterized protein (TIGR02246 family)
MKPAYDRLASHAKQHHLGGFMRSKYLLAAAVILSITAAAEDHGKQTEPKTAGHDMGTMQDEQMTHMEMMREMKDRTDIEELMWRYARTLDSTDADGYAATYTEDGEFVSPANSIKGHEALKNFIIGVKKSREERAAKGEKVTGTLHMTTNHIITFQDNDHATINAYWLTMFPGQGAETPARVGGVGRSVDELVRVNGKWLIKTRNVALKD